MARGIQYGRGLYNLVQTGMLLSSTIMLIRETKKPIEMSELMHGIYESMPLKNKKKQTEMLNDNVKMLNSSLTPMIKKINNNISTANKVLISLDFKHTIPKLSITNVRNVAVRRFKTIMEVEEAQKMSNELFEKSLAEIFDKPIKSIIELLEKISSERYVEDVNKISTLYGEGIKQSLNICSIGYYSTSVFVAGRTVETAINDYLKILFKLKKMEFFDVKEEKFDKKLNKLKASQLISEEMWHRLSSIRIERNTFGHPSKSLLTKKQAHTRIQIIIESISEIEKSIRKYELRLAKSRPLN